MIVVSIHIVLVQVLIKHRRAFEDLAEAKGIARDICIMRNLDHENILKVVDVLPPPSVEDFDVGSAVSLTKRLSIPTDGLVAIGGSFMVAAGKAGLQTSARMYCNATFLRLASQRR